MKLTLEELIRTCKGQRSYEQLSQDCGGNPTAGRIQQMATKTQHAFPDPETIKALARGLRVGTFAVIEACAVSLGISTENRTPALARLLPAGADTLTDGQINAVLATVHCFIESNRQYAEAS
ncbi:hypothetical protein [Arthrobacter caoxuetaonis]|uniref:Uncharacterized protein n=1 Tax=Arthrobacter caoxuetaonis TaxID=2886935 RepID=A0A9X1MGB7_9MICC|nr:hypothetical protein [Arthrobacter caoxuetaonis]MCC3299301.1 hypothetical protein [Arthrobacter caoxuetaonis]USQ59206.1 hypothetical protein NF551_16615 [Arthrobacter caoxuetaonis]